MITILLTFSVKHEFEVRLMLIPKHIMHIFDKNGRSTGTESQQHLFLISLSDNGSTCKIKSLNNQDYPHRKRYPDIILFKHLHPKSIFKMVNILKKLKTFSLPENTVKVDQNA